MITLASWPCCSVCNKLSCLPHVTLSKQELPCNHQIQGFCLLALWCSYVGQWQLAWFPRAACASLTLLIEKKNFLLFTICISMYVALYNIFLIFFINCTEKYNLPLENSSSTQTYFYLNFTNICSLLTPIQTFYDEYVKIILFSLLLPLHPNRTTLFRLVFYFLF